MPYKCQIIPKDKYAAIVDLWSVAFNINDSDVISGNSGEIERQLRYLEHGIDYSVGIFDGERLASVACITNFPMHFAGKWMTCGGIIGVASSPEYRRQRLVRKVLANCIDHLIEQKIPLSSLWPFSYSFYEQLGWATSDFRYEIALDLAELRKIQGNALNYRTHSPHDFNSAQLTHDRWTGNLNLSMKRSESRWKRQLENQNFRQRLFCHQDGYMLWNLSQSTSDLEISEWCYFTDDAYRDGLALIAQMDSQYKRARYQAPDIESLQRIVGASKAHEIKVVPGMMTRVADVGAFFEALGYANAEQIEIIDPIHGPADRTTNVQYHAGPGELITHLLGSFDKDTYRLPAELHGAAGSQRSFCIEKY